MTEGSTPIWMHRPQLFSLTCLPFAYDPAATCPQWEAFLNYVLESDQKRIALLQEYFGYCLIPGNKYQKFLMLEGVGGNGKGVTAAVLQEMLGASNVSNVGPEKFS